MTLRFQRPVLAAAFLAAWVSGCGEQSRLPLNENVTVQLDRSALGAGANLPISPTTTNINGAGTSISGKLLHVSPDWILIEQSTPQPSGTDIRKFWIQRTKVLLIQTRLDQGKGVGE